MAVFKPEKIRRTEEDWEAIRNGTFDPEKAKLRERRRKELEALGISYTEEELTQEKPKQEVVLEEPAKENQLDTTIIKVKIKDLVDFRNHPFSRGTDEKMEELAESIKQNGLFTPPIVRKCESGYELLAGHRRRDACKMIGLEEIEVVYRNVDDDTASLIMVSSNLEQRDKILPVEKGYAYKIMLEALKRQGQRSDLTSSQVGKKWSSDEVADKTGDSKNQVFRYIRLTELIYPLQERTNANQIGLTPAVDLSYLSKGEQTIVEETIVSEGLTISGSMAKELKALSRQGELSHDDEVDFLKITEIMRGNQEINIGKRSVKEVKMQVQKFRKLLPEGLQEIVLTQKIHDDIIEEAMALYCEKYEKEHTSEKEVMSINDNQPIIESEQKESTQEIKCEHHAILENEEDGIDEEDFSL